MRTQSTLVSLIASTSSLSIDCNDSSGAPSLELCCVSYPHIHIHHIRKPTAASKKLISERIINRKEYDSPLRAEFPATVVGRLLDALFPITNLASHSVVDMMDSWFFWEDGLWKGMW